MRLINGHGRCALFAAGCLAALSAFAQEATLSTVLFENVRIFNCTGSALSAPSNVLVRGNRIEKISIAPIPIDRRADTQVVRGGGRTLMPGLIDVHVHLEMWTIPIAFMASANPDYLQIREAVTAKEMLMDGFTSVRDMARPDLRDEASDRRGITARSAHLAFGLDDLADLRPWRLPRAH